MTGAEGGGNCSAAGDTIRELLWRDDLKAAVVEDVVDLEHVEDASLYAVGKDSILFDGGRKCIARGQEQFIGLDASQSQGNRKLNCRAFRDRSAGVGHYRGPSTSIKPSGGVYLRGVAVMSLADVTDEDVRESVIARMLILNCGE